MGELPKLKISLGYIMSSSPAWATDVGPENGGKTRTDNNKKKKAWGWSLEEECLLACTRREALRLIPSRAETKAFMEDKISSITDSVLRFISVWFLLL